MSGNFKYLLVVLLFLLTAAATPNFFQISMTFLVGFFLAYLTKGSRKAKVDKPK